MRRSLFDDDFFNGFGFDPFGMTRGAPQRRARQQQEHPMFYDPYVAMQQERERKAEELRRREEARRAEEERRRRVLEERRLKQQRMQQQQQQQYMDGEEDDESEQFVHPLQRLFGMPQRRPNREHQQQVPQPSQSQYAPATRQRSRTMEPQSDIPVPPVLARHPVFARLTPSQQQQFLRQQLQQQRMQEEQEREQRRVNPHNEEKRMVCDETQTSDDEEGTQKHRTVDEATGTSDSRITQEDLSPKPIQPDGAEKVDFKDCDDQMEKNDENLEYEECVETEKEARQIEERVERASNVSEQDSHNTEDDIDGMEEIEESPSPQGENSSAADQSTEKEETEAQEESVGPMCSLEEIKKIRLEAQHIEERWSPEAFVPATTDNKDSVKKSRTFYSEGLLQCVIKLDGIDSFGDASVRKARKATIIELEKKVEDLKAYAQKNDTH